MTTSDFAGQRALTESSLGTRLPRYRIRAIHLIAVWAFGVSQPVFSLIQGNLEILVASNATRLDALVAAALVALVPPLAATGYAWLGSRASRWVGDIVYLVLLGGFLVPFVLRVGKPVDPTAVTAIVVALAVCTGIVVLYAHSRVIRLFVGFSIVLPALGLLVLVHGLSPVTGDALASPRGKARDPHPVVILVLDEFPVSSLLTSTGEIDRVRYPSFGRLAREASWYPNATTSHDSTRGAMPSIITGAAHRTTDLPLAFHYPGNLFGLLGDEYAFNVHEAASRLCPREYCPQYAMPFVDRVLEISRRLRYLYIVRTLPTSLVPTFRDVDFERVQGGRMNETLRGFEGMLAGVQATGPRKSLHFAHVLVPHSPWRFFPSGMEYNFDGRDGLVERGHWDHDLWPALQAQQQHLLQVGFTDALLGRLLGRLDKVGLYDEALIIVTADHGISFKPGASHRWASPENVLDLANVPLFVKYPGQVHGRVDDRAASLVDIVPTIADVLDIDLPWDVQGSSLSAPPVRRSAFGVIGRGGGYVVEATLAQMIWRREVLLERKARWFGEGNDSLFAIGTNVDLIGVETRAPAAAPSEVRVRVDNHGALARVDRSSGFLPAKLSGRVSEGEIPVGTELAISVNGRVRALTRVIEWEGDHVFNALVPEWSLRDGLNQVDVFVIQKSGADRHVVWLGSNVPLPER